MFSTADTIVAAATPPGHGGLGVVRLSGPAARSIAETCLDRAAPLEPRRATFAHVVDATGPSRTLIDHVVATWFAGPQSYTGEDVVEISGHGSPILLNRIIDLAMRNGARLAEPGEFTLRAFLHGRLDLVQAEAVADLVAAVTPLQARVAMDQLEGTLTGAIGRIDAALFDLVARLEASLDFPDEGFHFVTRDDMRRDIGRVGEELAELASQGQTGRMVREGRLVVIAGRTNVGKSSIFNALAGTERAIVTDIPGTTRDLVTERVDVEGLPITLVDTAGMRAAQDAVEAEGIARARHAQHVAALTMVVVDASVALTGEDADVLRSAPSPRLIIRSKRDLPEAWPMSALASWPDTVVNVSAKSGVGLAELRHAVAAALTGREDLRDLPAISNMRHLALVHSAREALGRADAALQAGATEEVVLVDLGEARQALEEITGRRTSDDLLRHIFSRFCIGK